MDWSLPSSGIVFMAPAWLRGPGQHIGKIPGVPPDPQTTGSGTSRSSVTSAIYCLAAGLDSRSPCRLWMAVSGPDHTASRTQIRWFSVMGDPGPILHRSHYVADSEVAPCATV